MRLWHAPAGRNSNGWITAYERNRCYGGPEEGGWYYDWLTPLEGWELYTTNETIITSLKNKLRARYAEMDYEDVTIFRESNPGSHETTYRPTWE